MTLDNFSSLDKERKKSNNAWKIFLILIIFLLTVISIYFLFRHFKDKLPSKNETKKPLINKEDKKKDGSRPNDNNQEENNYQPVKPTQKEAEYQGTELPIYSAGTEYKKAVIETNMLPRGSAILTGSGDLEKQGIRAIIHACPGSIEKKDKNFRANIEGIIRSVQNSILLAEKSNYKSIAFCLIGSNLLDDIIPPNQGTKKERQIKLAEIIIKSAVEQRKGSEKIVFVDFGNTAFSEAWWKISEEYPRGGKMVNTFTIKGFTYVGKGKKNEKGITDFPLHKCEVIVNSLNIEGEFIGSGSFSGFIAGKTGLGKSKIQKEIKEHITEFNKRLKLKDKFN
ncbi:macro domain-containing protein [endosymbiont GvMRE of Glomus versiforme]|uniref:macro domain-containing protein n=1 Tax=endosymbiont GvMRE of Glomus versiforme TaxID=2039283 RepID=UPI000EE7A69A|nr:macro domain-containing protein [endosymbiont GvMRE of Glomus versiforme]RHZ36890.1 hypothetical protein GvMRE_I2g339 [endosymbiont GvMRE of Glomus versiforme]